MPTALRAPSNLSGRRLVEEGLLHTHRAVQLAAVELALDEGLERHARTLVNFVPLAAPEVCTAIRVATLEYPWRDPSSAWSRILIDWARPEQSRADGGPAPLPRLREGPPPHRLSTSRLLVAILLTVVDVLGVCLVALRMGAKDHAFSGFPKGADAYGHVSKVAILARTWPHIAWNADWYGGMPHFESSYPPLFHVVAALVVRLGRQSPAQAVTDVVAASVLLAATCLYGLIRVLSGSRTAGLAGAALFLGAPNLWSQVVFVGSDARIFGLGMLAFGLFATGVYLRRPSPWTLGLASVGLALAFVSHFLTFVLGIAGGGAMLLAAPAPTTRSRLWRALSVGVPAGGLAAFYYLPLVLLPRPKTTTATGTVPSALRTLFTPTSRKILDALPVTLVPLLIVAAIGAAVVLYRRWAAERSPLRRALRDAWIDPSALSVPTQVAPQRGERGGQSESGRAGVLVAAGAGLAGLGCVAFAVGGNFGLHVAVYGVNTFDVYVYAAWLLAVPALTMVAVIAAGPWWRRLVVFTPAVAAAAGACVFTFSLLNPVLVNNPGTNPTRIGLHAIFPAEAADQTLYRIGGITDLGQDWVSAYYDTPEVRGYQNQGTVNYNWQFLVERALYDTNLTLAERSFALDWYGVRWIYADDPSKGIPSALRKAPGAFRHLADSAKGLEASLWEYRRATPIASGTTAPVVLVIGAASDYDQFYRALAPAGLGSGSIITVRGSANVDDYSTAELKRFDGVVLWGARAHHWSDAGRALDGYVRTGGTLTIEAADTPVHEPRTPPSVFPVSDTAAGVAHGSFALTGDGSPLLQGLKLDSFSPALYNGSLPWDVVRPLNVAPWAHAVLRSGLVPIVVGGSYGAGHVYWSGMNLPFHASAYNNPVESLLLARLVTNGHVGPAHPSPLSAVENPNPEREKVSAGPGSRGVLFKETAMPNWHASAGGRSIPIYRAGPDFMWVSLPPGQTVVTFTYQASTADRLGWFMTVTTLLALSAYALGLRPPVWVRSRVARLRDGPSTMAVTTAI